MDLVLREDPVPSGDTESEIRKNPKVCSTCWNLHPGSALWPAGLGIVSMHTESGAHNANRLAKTRDIGRPPAWAGEISRLDYTSFTFYAKLTDVHASALSCDTCRILVVAVTKLSEGKADWEDPLMQLDIVFCKDTVLWISLQRDNNQGEVDFSEVFSDLQQYDEPWTTELIATWDLYLLFETTCPWPTIGNQMNREGPRGDVDSVLGGSAAHVASDGASQQAFDKIKQWLKICDEDHSDCRRIRSSSPTVFPKRLLDIGDPSNDMIRLTETEETQEVRSYLALSHCWGPTQHLVTTKATLEERKRKVHFEQLSRNFKDAIAVARGLGIQHLWIDSLCIIQDDRDDWAAEAAKMASIYNGAYLVLAATCSPDGEKGFLHPRKPHIQIDGTATDGSTFHIYGRKSLDHEEFGWSNTRPELVTDYGSYAGFPLLSRAWCLQERLLATRLVHFTREEMIFECTSVSCECGAMDGFDRSPHFQRRRDLFSNRIEDVQRVAEDNTPAPNEKSAIADFDFDTWRLLAGEYSLKSISKTSDRLPAIAGLASKWATAVQTGRYLAGLWEESLLWDLAWEPLHREEEGEGCELPYIAPSWSWLSVQRPITYGLMLEPVVKNSSKDSRRSDRSWFRRHRHFFVEVNYERTACHPTHMSNPLGEVSAGYIYLTGVLMPVYLEAPWKEGPGSSVNLRLKGNANAAFFNRRDNKYRWREHSNETLYCLRFSNYCIRGMQRQAEDTALVLARAALEERARQPRHVREYDHVYIRVGITYYYPTEEWEHDHNARKVGIYII